MEISEKELEKRLLDAGKTLLSPQLTSTELIKSLDLVENLLSEVEQSPSESMKEALAPSSKALVDNQLLKHSDADVRVAVASCISEITRITAPEAPYADDEMKEVFELIVSTFEKLDDISTSRTYTKKISILETVAKVRSCVVMLDLECDDLIVQMFRHFLRTIRDNHDKGVFSSMETIMALVLEESETIPTDLLFPMLDVLSKENKEVRPIARQLAENVIANCTDKLKPYLLLAIRALDTTLDDYTKVVSDVYKARDEVVKPTDGDASNANLADNNDTINPSAEQADEVAMETLEDAPPSEEAGPTTVVAPKTAVDNGVNDDEDSSAANDNSLKTDNETQNEKVEPSKTNVDSSTVEEPPKKSKKKPKKSSKRKGKKQKASKSASEPAVSDHETADVDTRDHQDDSMDVDNLEGEDPADDTTDAANNAKSSEAPVLSPKASDSECADVSPPSPSGSHADETRSKKVKQEEKKEDPGQEGETADEVDVGKESVIKKDTEEATGSKNKPEKQASKKSSSASDHEESAPVSADDSKKEESIHQLEDSAVKDSAKETEDGSLLADKKKRTQSKSTPAKGNKKTPAKDEKKKAVALPKSTPKVAKDESDAKETLKSSSKRKRPSEEKSSKSKVYDAGLVGATVKVYWQLDNEYYEGVVDSFDDVKKRHKIVYHDGDIEVLNLREEKWMVVSYPKGHAGDGDSPDSADEMPLRSKIKTSADVGGKTGKTGSNAKKSAGASSSKSKAASKSGSNDRKAASNSKEELTKKVGKSDTDKSGKSKSSKSGNKLSDDTPKSGKTLKDDEDLETVKGSSKSKQDTTKTATKSKGKSLKSVSKGKAGTTSTYQSTKDEDTEDDSVEPARTPEKSKTKSQSSSKSQNNSKKRKR